VAEVSRRLRSSVILSGLALAMSVLASGCGAGTGMSSQSAGHAAPSGGPGAAAASAAPPASTPAATPITISIPTAGGPSSIPLFVAQDLGLFEKHGLKATVTVMSNEASSMAALSNGDVTFSAAIGSAARAAERGLPVRVVMDFANSPTFVLVGDKGVSSVAALKGKTVALYSPGSTGSEVGAALMADDGLRPGDYKVAYAGPNPAHIALLKAHKVAATLIDAPTVVPLIHEGYPLLDNATQKVELPEAGLAASLTVIRDHPDWVRRAVAALADATQLVRTQKNVVVPVIAKHLKESAADAAEGYDLIHSVWTADGRPTPGALRFEFQSDVHDLKLKQTPNADQIYDLSFLPAGGTSTGGA
jgi:ABC-type nitrate/sulfonate/bicarbonate transport system substrate-binding protein